MYEQFFIKSIRLQKSVKKNIFKKSTTPKTYEELFLKNPRLKNILKKNLNAKKSLHISEYWIFKDNF